jgi:hypothetical protein
MRRFAPVALAVAAVTAALGMLSTPAGAAPKCNAGVAAQLERGLPVTPFNLGRRLGQTIPYPWFSLRIRITRRRRGLQTAVDPGPAT